MATPPIPMPMRPPGAGGPGAPGAPGGGVGLPKSPIGGPSGPGGSPMVSPGTGAGMQARALASIKKIMDSLMALAKDFQPGTPQFNGIVGAIKSLNGATKEAPVEPPKTPLPVPPTAPGGGLGGLGAPPTGGPPGGMPAGGAMGGAGPIEPPGEM